MRSKILDFKNSKKIAIMGGTFNPIHYGHLVAGEYVREKFDIDKVVFIPTGNPPHKDSNIAHTEHRYIMTLLATSENPNFLVSPIEIDRQGITYTIDTLKEIKDMCSENTEIYFITGIDTINQIIHWKNSSELFEFTKFIVVQRPDYVLDDNIENIKKEQYDKIYFCKIPKLSISSTQIRKRVDNDKTISYLLPEAVKDYIYKNNLYKTDYFKKYASYIEKIKKVFPEKRFNHSMEVAKEAKKLAYNYNCDEDKAFLAGVLHDCAKYFSIDKIREVFAENNFTIDYVIEKQPDIAHSFLGYFIAKNEYGVYDEEILSSIKYHTTGRKNMTLLEKIIYISDYIEPTRAHFEGVEKARKLAYENIDKAMEYILKSTIIYNEQKGRLIHHLSKEAYEFYKK